MFFIPALNGAKENAAVYTVVNGYLCCMVEHIDVAILKQNLHEINSKSLYVGYNATLNALLRSISDGQVAQSK